MIQSSRVAFIAGLLLVGGAVSSGCSSTGNGPDAVKGDEASGEIGLELIVADVIHSLAWLLGS